MTVLQGSNLLPKGDNQLSGFECHAGNSGAPMRTACPSPYSVTSHILAPLLIKTNKQKPGFAYMAIFLNIISRSLKKSLWKIKINYSFSVNFTYNSINQNVYEAWFSPGEAIQAWSTWKHLNKCYSILFYTWLKLCLFLPCSWMVCNSQNFCLVAQISLK